MKKWSFLLIISLIFVLCNASAYSDSLRKLKVKPVLESKYVNRLYDGDIQKKVTMPSVLVGSKLQTKIILKLTDKNKTIPDAINTIRLLSKKDNIISYKLIGKTKTKHGDQVIIDKKVLQQEKNIFLTKDQWRSIVFESSSYQQYILIIKAKLPLVLAEVNAAYNQTDFNIDGFNDIFISDPIRSSNVSFDSAPVPDAPGQIHIMNGGFAETGVDFNTGFDGVIETNDMQQAFGLDMVMTDVISDYSGSELVVLAPNMLESNGFNTKGNIYIYSKADGAWQVVQTLSGINPLQMVCGDVTGDGFLDLITLEIVENLQSLIFNVVLKVYRGSSSGFAIDNVIVSNPIELNSIDSDADISLILHFGVIFNFTIVDVMDLNKDGISDIILSIPDPTINSIFYTLGSANLGTQDLNATNLDMSLFNNYFIFSLTNAGDLNSDGYDDLALGSPGFNFDGEITDIHPSVFLLMSNQIDFNKISQQVLPPTVNSLGFGYSVKKAGDFNGDGFDDLLIFSMELSEWAFLPVVKLYLLRGGVEINLSNLLEVMLPNSGTFVLLNAHPLGDVNGDGYDDILIVQFPVFNGFFTSSCMIVFGGEDENLETGSTVRVIASPNNDGVLFGSSAI